MWRLARLLLLAGAALAVRHGSLVFNEFAAQPHSVDAAYLEVVGAMQPHAELGLSNASSVPLPPAQEFAAQSQSVDGANLEVVQAMQPHAELGRSNESSVPLPPAQEFAAQSQSVDAAYLEVVQATQPHAELGRSNASSVPLPPAQEFAAQSQSVDGAYLEVAGAMQPYAELGQSNATSGYPWPASLDNLEYLKLLGGSTEPWKVKWLDGSGTWWLFVKKKAHVSEAVANSIYGVYGAVAPHCKMYNGDDMLCRWLDLEKTFTAEDLITDPDCVNELDRHYLLDAVLQNYDISGNDGNVGRLESGRIVRIDNGGTLLRLANGREKFRRIDAKTPWIHRIKTFTPYPYDIWDLRREFSWFHTNVDKKKRRRGKSLEDLLEQAKQMKHKQNKVFKMIEYHFSEDFPKEAREIWNLFASRVGCLTRLAEQRNGELVQYMDGLAKTDGIFAALEPGVVQRMEALCGETAFTKLVNWISSSCSGGPCE